MTRKEDTLPPPEPSLTSTGAEARSRRNLELVFTPPPAGERTVYSAPDAGASPAERTPLGLQPVTLEPPDPGEQAAEAAAPAGFDPYRYQVMTMPQELRRELSAAKLPRLDPQYLEDTLPPTRGAAGGSLGPAARDVPPRSGVGRRGVLLAAVAALLAIVTALVIFTVRVERAASRPYVPYVPETPPRPAAAPPRSPAGSPAASPPRVTADAPRSTTSRPTGPGAAEPRRTSDPSGPATSVDTSTPGPRAASSGRTSGVGAPRPNAARAARNGAPAEPLAAPTAPASPTPSSTPTRLWTEPR